MSGFDVNPPGQNQMHDDWGDRSAAARSNGRILSPSKAFNNTLNEDVWDNPGLMCTVYQMVQEMVK